MKIPSRLVSAISAAIFLSFWSSGVPVGAQQVVLSPESREGSGKRSGTLRRFDLSNDNNEALKRMVLGSAKAHDLDVWGVTKSYIDIYWPSSSEYTPSNAHKVPQDLMDIPHTTSLIHQPELRKSLGEEDWDLTSLENSTFHSSYHRLDETDKFMLQLTKQFPNHTELHRIGLSAEGRDLYALKIATPGEYAPPEDDVDGGKGGKKKKKKKKKKEHRHLPHKLSFVVVGAQHAREWIATATSLYLAHALAIPPATSLNTTEPNSLHSLLDVFNFYIIPSPNPDGYVYTWEEDRYWYKNRQTLAAGVPCKGLDTNRNWGYEWHHEPVEGAGKGLKERVEGARKPDIPVDPCSHWYPGSRPFQAPEANSIANYVATIPDLIGFLDLRSYGQMVSTPYSYSCQRMPKDIEDQTEAAYGAVQAIKGAHGAHFDAGRVCENLYEAPGNILDWMYAKAGIKYAYAVHLRDTGTYGFSLPAKWIRPVGEETARMVRFLGKFIAAKTKRKL